MTKYVEDAVASSRAYERKRNWQKVPEKSDDDGRKGYFASSFLHNFTILSPSETNESAAGFAPWQSFNLMTDTTNNMLIISTTPKISSRDLVTRQNFECFVRENVRMKRIRQFYSYLTLRIK